MIKIMYAFILVAVLASIASIFLAKNATAPADLPLKVNEEKPVMCTADAIQCSDGSFVGRTGPKCEFICPNNNTASTSDKTNLIRIDNPVKLAVITSPLQISGSARGTWFFEGSFPVVLTNWDGLIIAQGLATTTSEWMTTDFVPFVANLEFVNPYVEAQEDFMKNGFLILRKDNPSGLPEKDDALEIPVRFAP